MVPLLDTHQHLIYPDRFAYPWTEPLPALAGQAFALEDYRELTKGLGVGGTIFMEAAVADDQIEAEAEAVAELMRAAASGILGMVASIRPERDEGFGAWLERAPELGAVGFRRILHVVPDGVSRTDTFRANVRRIGAAGLPFDMCFLARQLPLALELARACEGTSLVLDHCGVPAIASGGLDPWRADIAALAAMPNVTAKISGVFAYCAAGTASAATVRPWVEHVLDAFGPARCLWGSDWPVVNLGADLPAWITAFRDLTAGLSPDEAAAVSHGTAERVYGVRLDPAHRQTAGG